jgi:hypothetical protein
MKEHPKHMLGYNLSHKDNTPEHRLLLARAMGKNQNKCAFETTWGHFVTKILDLRERGALTYQANTYEEVEPFRSKADIMGFFWLDEEDLSKQPQSPHVEQRLSRLYKEKFQALDESLLAEWITEAKNYLTTELGIPSDMPVKLVDLRESLRKLCVKDTFFHTVWTQEELDNELLMWSDMRGMPWEEIIEDAMSSEQQLNFYNDLVHRLVRFPEAQRVDEQIDRIRGAIVGLIQINHRQIRELEAGWIDFLARRKSGFVSWQPEISNMVDDRTNFPDEVKVRKRHKST